MGLFRRRETITYPTNSLDITALRDDMPMTLTRLLYETHEVPVGYEKWEKVHQHYACQISQPHRLEILTTNLSRAIDIRLISPDDAYQLCAAFALFPQHDVFFARGLVISKKNFLANHRRDGELFWYGQAMKESIFINRYQLIRRLLSNDGVPGGYFQELWQWLYAFLR